jgi:ribosomal-protein-alanine N-acetyltransferase
MLKIHTLLLSYLDEVLEIERLVNSELSPPWTRRMFLDELNSATAHYWVLTESESDKVLGFIGCHFIDPEAFITNFAVHPEYQKQGNGQALMEAFLGRLKSWSCESVSLEVRVNNERALKFYEAHGFKAVGLRKNYYPTRKGFVDGVLMKLELK